MLKEIATHRSVRRFLRRDIAPEVLTDILQAATHASTVGNMQLYSIIVTIDSRVRHELAADSVDESAAEEAAVLLVFCADVSRFSKWCAQRDTQPEYQNLMWYAHATADALRAAENAAVQAEVHGLGICFVDTVLRSADRLVELLSLPRGVVPTAVLAVGYPAEQPPVSDRLPMEAVVHYDRYNQFTSAEIDELWAERETSEQTLALLEHYGADNLARIFTDFRYPADDNMQYTKRYLATLRAQDFIDNEQ
jgi:nitroreductase